MLLRVACRAIHKCQFFTHIGSPLKLSSMCTQSDTRLSPQKEPEVSIAGPSIENAGIMCSGMSYCDYISTSCAHGSSEFDIILSTLSACGLHESIFKAPTHITS